MLRRLGKLHSAADPGLAKTHLSEALDLYERLGLTEWASVCRLELNRLR